MKIIVPCAGKSSRFPNVRPKWMLNAPSGNLMVVEALKGLNAIGDYDVVITILQEHEDKYNIIEGLKKNFSDNFHFEPTFCILESPTTSQSETVYKTLEKEGYVGSFLIKDSDNYFEIDNVKENYSYVTTCDLNDCDMINPANKSYVKYDEQGSLSSIVEKKVISSHFSVGGYYFVDSEKFRESYLYLKNAIVDKEIYISDIIDHQISSQEKFFNKKCNAYKDWGTLKDWMEYRKTVKTYFVDIDGVLFKNGAEFFSPKWGTTEPILDNLNRIKRLKQEGNYIVVTTSRTEEFREITLKQFEEFGLEVDQLVMGITSGQRVLINDFSDSNPYPSAVAVNISRDSNNLDTLI